MNDNDTDCADHVTDAEAIDWLIRSAVPTFLDLVTLDEEAAWFRSREPYSGRTTSGRLRGWPGVGKRLEAVLDSLHPIHSDVVAVLQDGGRPTRYYNPGPEPEHAEYEQRTREVAVFARTATLPSQIGWTAYRLIGECHTLAMLADELNGGAGIPYEVEQAWCAAWQAITDRARLGALTRTTPPEPIGPSGSVAVPPKGGGVD